jgi:hypothetical protein
MRTSLQVYCSVRCRGRAKEQRKAAKRSKGPVGSRSCAWCGETFDSNQTQRLYCSDRCKTTQKYRRDVSSGYERVKMNRRNARHVSTARPPIEKTCEDCGAAFQAAGQRIDDHRFCSRACAVQSRRRKDPSLAASGADHRRRARKGGVTYEPGLTWHRLVAEDGSGCWLCGEDVDPADKAPSGGGWAIGRRYPTVDHVVPMARGGHHVRGNVRLAHLVCNSARGISVVRVPRASGWRSA